MNTFNETDWYSLELSVKDGSVIPIIGPDALMVDYEGRTVPFYRLVSADLLKSFQIELEPEMEVEILQHTWSLHRAVSVILAKKAARELNRMFGEKSRGSSRTIANLPNLPIACAYWLAFRHSNCLSV